MVGVESDQQIADPLFMATMIWTSFYYQALDECETEECTEILLECMAFGFI